MAKRIDIKGQIVNSSDDWIYDWLGIENCSPKKVNAALLEANGDDIEIYINSPGGIVSAGSEIYTEIRSYQGKKLIKIIGMAASAASVIAQAGESEISPTGMIMIHNVQTQTSGDYRDMDNTGDALRAANQSIINAYVDKTGMSQDELQDLMDRETYMSAQQAVEYGFVDRIMFRSSDGSTPELVNGLPGIIPEQTLEKLRNLIKDPEQSDFLMQKKMAAARLRLINLKGEQR